jgi:tripartite-type tricarboxylate transporter receptor subunit TctC
MNAKQESLFQRSAGLALAAALAFGVLAAPGARAQAYPDKPVKVVVPYPAGAVGDVMMRIVAERLAAKYGQQFVIDNRAGGGGLAAAKAVADALPDGYTLLLNGPNHVTNLGLYKNVPYDPIADFVPVTHIGSSQTMLVAHTSTGFNEISQIVAAAKAKPGIMNFASSGSGTGTHLSMEMLMRATGTKFTHISYKGGSPAAVGLGGGEVQVGFSSVPLVQPMIETGKLVPILVGGNKRLTAYPKVPSLGELGMLNYDVEVWFGLFAPKGTPPAIVEKISSEVRAMLAEPGMAQRFDKLGFTAVGSTPAEFDAMVRKEYRRWPELIRELNIQAN